MANTAKDSKESGAKEAPNTSSAHFIRAKRQSLQLGDQFYLSFGGKWLNDNFPCMIDEQLKVTVEGGKLVISRTDIVLDPARKSPEQKALEAKAKKEKEKTEGTAPSPKKAPKAEDAPKKPAKESKEADKKDVKPDDEFQDE